MEMKVERKRINTNGFDMICKLVRAGGCGENRCVDLERDLVQDCVAPYYYIISYHIAVLVEEAKRIIITSGSSPLFLLQWSCDRPSRPTLFVLGMLRQLGHANPFTKEECHPLNHHRKTCHTFP